MCAICAELPQPWAEVARSVTVKECTDQLNSPEHLASTPQLSSAGVGSCVARETSRCAVRNPAHTSPKHAWAEYVTEPLSRRAMGTLNDTAGVRVDFDFWRDLAGGDDDAARDSILWARKYL